VKNNNLGQEDLCEDFFAYNLAKGTLYDGGTRLFLQNGTYKIHTTKNYLCMLFICSLELYLLFVAYIQILVLKLGLQTSRVESSRAGLNSNSTHENSSRIEPSS
jgi:hypothetical protein